MRKKKSIIFLFLICLVIIFAPSFTFNEKFSGNAKIFKTSESDSFYQGVIVYADDLISDLTDETSMNYNTKYLQSLIDKVSDIGGGTVKIPSGTFYFSSDLMNKKNTENYIIKCRDNVTIEGNGTGENTGTILKPYGITEYGLDMFYYNEYEDIYGNNSKYLENADFKNFVIDAENTTGNNYNSSGNGFMINLFKNCDWELVTVQNTDGSGFKIGYPINSTLTKCITYDCGKSAEKEVIYGASGFEVNTGYSDNETIYINDCIAIGNKKYGFYFSHQDGDNNLYKAIQPNSVVLENCISSENMYDYGGENANNVTIQNSGAYIELSSEVGFYFDNSSQKINIINCVNEQLFLDIADKSLYYYTPVYWALNNGLVQGINKNEFFPLDIYTKTEVIDLLWNLSGRTKKIFLDGDDNVCTRENFIMLLWEYAGKPVAQTQNEFIDIETGTDLENAVNWAVSKGLFDGIVEDEFLPDTQCTKGEILTYLYRFSKTNSEFSIKYNLMGGIMENENPDSYVSGEDIFTLNNPIKDGYTFVGWSGSNCTGQGNLEQIFTPEEMVVIDFEDVGNKVYTAHWEPNIYIVSFDANGGTGEMLEENFEFDSAKVLNLNKFVKDGYEFKEWNTQKDGSGESFRDAQAVKNLTNTFGDEIILYAQWEKSDLENRENIFIGDDFVLEMRNIINSDEIWVAERGAGIDWIKTEGVAQIENNINSNTNIIIRIGTNDVFYKYLNNGNVDIDNIVEKYVRYFNAQIVKWKQLGAKVYFVSSGPYDDSKIAEIEKVNNMDILEFNSKIKEELNGIIYLDIYSEFVYEYNEGNVDLTREDGIFGTALAYSKQYKLIKRMLGQDIIATYEVLEKMVDVEETDSYYEAVKWGFENVYIEPKVLYAFEPQNIMTRADIITLLWRYKKMPYVDFISSKIIDISESDLYYDAINWGISNGIIDDNITLFEPDEICSSVDFIIWLWRMAGSPVVGSQNEFTDIEEGDIYENAINWAVNKGIIKEDFTGEFELQEYCSRELAITSLYNYNYYNDFLYTVNYDFYTNGGTSSEINIDKLYYGNEIDLSVIATKEGYEFVGWNTDKDARVGLTKLNIKDETITLYAIFKKDIQVTFIDYQDTQKIERVETLTIYNNETGNIVLPVINTYTGWISKHWYNENSDDILQGKLAYEEINNITQDITLYGIYAKEICIKFNLNNGMGDLPDNINSYIYANSMNIELTTEVEVKLPEADIYKDNFSFCGWNTRTDGDGDTLQCGYIYGFAKDTVLYAKWKANNEFPFVDVQKTDWCYGAVKYVYNKGFILGTSYATYEPGSKLTRGMIVTILNRMEGYNIVDRKMKFEDVNFSAYYYDSVKWAASVGIIHGYEDGLFRPDKYITREELAVILRNYTIYKGENTEYSADLSKFNDGNTVTGFAVSAMEWAVYAGVITGYTDTNTIKPQETATRDVVASMLYKYYNSYIMEG